MCFCLRCGSQQFVLVMKMSLLLEVFFVGLLFSVTTTQSDMRALSQHQINKDEPGFFRPAQHTNIQIKQTFTFKCLWSFWHSSLESLCLWSQDAAVCTASPTGSSQFGSSSHRCSISDTLCWFSFALCLGRVPGEVEACRILTFASLIPG